MERQVDYAGRNFTIHYRVNPKFIYGSDLATAHDEPIGMARRVLAENEYTYIKSQAPELISLLQESLKKIPSDQLIFRKVVDTIRESEVFKTFKGISQYTCEVWDEGFLCEMAHDVVKQMTPNDIRENLDLFCSLCCIARYADLDLRISDIDKGEIGRGILRFRYTSSQGVKFKTEKIMTNVFDSENRKITTRLVQDPAFTQI